MPCSFIPPKIFVETPNAVSIMSMARSFMAAQNVLYQWLIHQIL